MKDEGYALEQGGKVITIFSAPNYCDQVSLFFFFFSLSLPLLFLLSPFSFLWVSTVEQVARAPSPQAPNYSDQVSLFFLLPPPLYFLLLLVALPLDPQGGQVITIFSASNYCAGNHLLLSLPLMPFFFSFPLDLMSCKAIRYHRLLSFQLL